MLRQTSAFFFPPRAVYPALREHLVAKINSDYIHASVVTKWIDWIGQKGIDRANNYITWLKSDDVKGLSDYELAGDILVSFTRINIEKGVSLAESRNLRLMIARETFDFLNEKEDPVQREENKMYYRQQFSQRMSGGHSIPGHAEYVQLSLLKTMIRIILKRKNISLEENVLHEAKSDASFARPGV